MVTPPDWLGQLLGVELPAESSVVQLGERSYVMRGGILRADDVVSDEHAQTGDTFGFKWHQRETFDSYTRTAAMRDWLLERYGDVAAAMHHIKFDWFAPANAHRQSPEEVRAWCDEAGLEIEHEDIQGAGITIVTRKRS